ncbi:MAG: hypothetical protein WCA16_00410 [Candidatus Sulfotelmatobacter sp.]
MPLLNKIDSISTVLVRRIVMKKLAIVLAFSGLSCSVLCGQQATAPAAPQTARQALLEMFFSKTPGTLVKHLPEVTRAALDKSGALTTMQEYSVLASQFQAQGKNFQTFETGSIVLATDDPKTGQKFEVTVQNDSLQGDEDDLEISFQGYKDGKAERTPFMPRMTFVMKTESGVWKLNEIDTTIRLPLADPDFLKSLTEKMKRQPAMQGTFAPQPQTSVTFGSDPQVLAAMRTILTAETVYANTYRAVGYTCTLSDLDGFGGGEANEHQAMLISSSLASGKRFGYVFTLSGCAGSPAGSFHLTAAPNGNGFGRHTFCTDQTAVIRSSTDGNPATCTASGTPVQ